MGMTIITLPCHPVRYHVIPFLKRDPVRILLEEIVTAQRVAKVALLHLAPIAVTYS